MFIALEGIDGVGKTTSCNLLQKKLSLQNKATVIHDPDENEPIGKFVIQSLQTLKEKYAPSVWAMLYSCSSINLQSGNNGYLNKLQNKEIVILDRTVLSTYAYYWGKCSLLWLDEIHKPYIYPDLTIILDLDAQVNFERLQKRDKGTYIPELEHLKKLKEYYNKSYLHLINNGINIKYVHVNETEKEEDVVNKIEELITYYYNNIKNETRNTY